MLAQGSKRAVWVFGARMAVTAGTRLAGLTGLGLTGWGLVFLAFGLVFEVGVLLLSADALQQHLQKSYFGNGDSDKRYKSLKEEEAALVTLGEQAKPPLPSASSEHQPFSDPMTGWVAA